jgi:hypothetical protein
VSAATDLGAALRPVVEALEHAGARYRIGGSVASSALGVPRSTLDVDLVTDLEARAIAGFVAALQDDYYIDEDAVRDAVRRRGSFNLIHLSTMLKVDVFIAKSAPFDRVSFDRHVDRALTDEPGARIYSFRSAEDVVLRKLEWYRLGGETSERQWNDTIGVLRVQAAAIDRDYLEHWARELGVHDLLERAIADAHAGDSLRR